MKIFIVGPKSIHTMGALVAKEAIVMGHTIYHFEDRSDNRFRNQFFRKIKYVFSKLRPGLSPRLKKLFFQNILNFDPDLVIVISVNKMLPDIIQEAKQLCNAKFVAWYPDAIGGFFDQPVLACDYDHIFVKCHDLVARLIALGKNVTYLPEACSPEYDKRVDIDPFYCCDVSTAGSYYSYRIQMLSVLAGLDLNLYGISKDKYGEEKQLKSSLRQKDIFLVERAKLYSSSKLIVNTLHPTEANSMNVRLFESVCSGTPVITEYRPALDDLFVDGKEVISFRTKHELREKVEYFLSHPDEAKIIGVNGAKRALKDHTYNNRIQQIIDIVMN